MKSSCFFGSLIILFFTMIIMAIDQADAECCPATTVYCESEMVYFEQEIGDGCSAKICYDGSALDEDSYYCGQGPCNIFGCNCDGGCRSNVIGTFDEAIRLFEGNYNLKII